MNSTNTSSTGTITLTVTRTVDPEHGGNFVFAGLNVELDHGTPMNYDRGGCTMKVRLLCTAEELVQRYNSCDPYGTEYSLAEVIEWHQAADGHLYAELEDDDTELAKTEAQNNVKGFTAFDGTCEVCGATYCGTAEGVTEANDLGRSCYDGSKRCATCAAKPAMTTNELARKRVEARYDTLNAHRQSIADFFDNQFDEYETLNANRYETE